MKKFLTFLGFCFCLNSFAQDTLIWKNGNRMLVHILSVDSVVLRCQVPDEANGEKFSVAISELAAVHYENGIVRSAEEVVLSSEEEKKFKAEEKRSKAEYHFHEYRADLRPKPDPAGFRITSVTTDLVPGLINEFNLCAEFKINYTYSIRIGYGKLFYNGAFDPFVFSPSQSEWPGTVYEGDAGMIYLKHYNAYKQGKYFSIGGIYKDMYYSNHSFLDIIDREPFHYVRSEHATVRGFDLVWGRQYYSGNGHILIEFNYGFGMRSRSRYFTTYSVDYESSPVPPLYSPIPYGPGELKQVYPTIHLGLLIGFCFKDNSPVSHTQRGSELNLFDSSEKY
jgi:hypothetical protein